LIWNAYCMCGVALYGAALRAESRVHFAAVVRWAVCVGVCEYARFTRACMRVFARVCDCSQVVIDHVRRERERESVCVCVGLCVCVCVCG
jgi:hypothetical protein